ncbi:MAG: transporter substrate-binding domain-containing protein [Leptospira sp.]|nr:transporter substrate-binding domain-containing protein [Leptospira sp.]
MKFLRPFISLAFAFYFSASCIAIWESINGVDIKDIKKAGKLRVITAYGANSYFIYKGQAMGFEYEMLRLLAEDIGVELEIITTSDMDNIAYMLNSGLGDIVAANLAVTGKQSRELQFTEHLMLTKQVLVQRNPGYYPKGEVNAKTKFIRTPVDLIGKKVHERKNSPFYERLKNLSEEIGGEIEIETVAGDVITEELIRKVNDGEIDYTVVDEPTALINRAYYPDLDVSVPISFPQRISWVVRAQSPELLSAVNQWIFKVKSSATLSGIYNKYYSNPRAYRERVTSEFFSKTGSKISSYDKFIKETAKKAGWDWRLIASVVFQESRFNPRAQSWAGAKGLMQIMPATGRGLGLAESDIMDPQKNIFTGVKFLKYLDESELLHGIKNKDERLKFVLASYNAGPGHVEDARKLARQFKKNPDVWDENVGPYIVKLSDPAYFNRDGIKHGYCRGEEPYNYVKEIIERHKRYKDFIKE